MSLSNRDRIAKGLEALLAGLEPYVLRELQAHLGGYWQEKVGDKLQTAKLANGGIRWDNYSLLKAMKLFWPDVFAKTLGNAERNWAHEAADIRNDHAHDKPFTSDDAYRALDTLERLLMSIGAQAQSEAVREQRMELQRAVYAEQARNKTRYQPTLLEGAPKAGLRSWREIVTPHVDVAGGTYLQAEFAADLHNVSQGVGGVEYVNPEEFYRRTYLTDGLTELLVGALQRMAGRGGDPVVELQTNFGGGKTHSMLALYHLFGGAPSAGLFGMEPLLHKAGVDAAPKANRAVLVGTHLSVGEVSRKPDGTTVRTMWGEMAWQLGGAPAYALVAESDAHSTAPGAQVLTELFRKTAPALVLIDEWVAYARNTVDRRELPSGDFDSQATFAQALTEAAKSVDQVLVVASIPSSDIEVGGQNGKHALAVLKNVFERVGKTWRPATSDEGFEIVRRRLFEPVSSKDAPMRDAVIEAFSRMYREGRSDYPFGCGDEGYRKKLEAAYPIHPDVFDQLYGEWSKLDKFQRTRGVLRLLAKVIHRLWENNDAGLLIMPASIPMDDPGIRAELTRYLDDVWEPILSSDIDGPNSLPLELDRQNPTLGRYSACRRVARALYLGTAPGSRDKNPGIDDRRVRLGCCVPGETGATFGDALRRISDRAKHIHQDGNRYWVSTKANLNRLADDRASTKAQAQEELYAELVARIREECKQKANRGDFAAVHPCPESTSEVPDEPQARLVVLGPQYPHRKGLPATPALTFARTLLDQRGNSPRLSRNMLVFLAADQQRIDELLPMTAQYLAWQSILDDAEALNLDPFQRKQAESKRKDADERVNLLIREAWQWCLVPQQSDDAEGSRPEDRFTLDEIKVSGQEALARRASQKLKNEEQLLPAMGGSRLRMELDRWLWRDKDHVSLGQLAEWFPRYLYLPRIVDKEVLVGAIRDGMGQILLDDTFALADRFDDAEGRYRNLQLRGPRGHIDNSTLLVKPTVAKAQILQDEREAADKALADALAKKEAAPEGSGIVHPHGVGDPGLRPQHTDVRPTEKPKQPNLFTATVELDPNRLGRDAGKIAEEVLQHLTLLTGARAKVSLEIEIVVPAGVADDVVRTVTENCNTLKFKRHGFERE
jgi:predicted AAA+ superfamily ATPase